MFYFQYGSIILTRLLASIRVTRSYSSRSSLYPLAHHMRCVDMFLWWCVAMVMCYYGDVLLWWCVAMVTCLLLLSPGAAYCQFMDMLFSGEVHQCQAHVHTIVSHILHCISVRILAQLCVCSCYQIGKGLAIRQKPLQWTDHLLCFCNSNDHKLDCVLFLPHF